MANSCDVIGSIPDNGLGGINITRNGSRLVATFYIFSVILHVILFPQNYEYRMRIAFSLAVVTSNSSNSRTIADTMCVLHNCKVQKL